MSTAAIMTSTRHVVIDLPIGPRVEPSDDHGFDAAFA